MALAEPVQLLYRHYAARQVRYMLMSSALTTSAMRTSAELELPPSFYTARERNNASRTRQ